MKAKVWIILLLSLGLSACAMTASGVSRRQAIPILESPPTEPYTVIRHFIEVANLCRDVTGKLNIDSVITKIRRETGADAIINLEIRERQTLDEDVMEGFTRYLTMGLASCRDTVVEGDAIQFSIE